MFTTKGEKICVSNLVIWVVGCRWFAFGLEFLDAAARTHWCWPWWWQYAFAQYRWSRGVSRDSTARTWRSHLFEHVDPLLKRLGSLSDNCNAKQPQQKNLTIDSECLWPMRKHMGAIAMARLFVRDKPVLCKNGKMFGSYSTIILVSDTLNTMPQLQNDHL